MFWWAQKIVLREEFEDTTEIIRIRKSKNSPENTMAKRKSTKNDLQNILY
jgi:hypothetical protein